MLCYTLYTALYYTTLCTLYTLHCTLYTTPYYATLHSVHYTTLCTLHYTLYTTLHYCTLYTTTLHYLAPWTMSHRPLTLSHTLYSLHYTRLHYTAKKTTGKGKSQKVKVNHSTQDSRVVPHRGTN
jgi:hypothetical protein